MTGDLGWNCDAEGHIFALLGGPCRMCGLECACYYRGHIWPIDPQLGSRCDRCGLVYGETDDP